MKARMDIRLEENDKKLIERAARLQGVKTATFTRAALVREAEAVIRDAHVVKFDEDAAREFLLALSRPFEPNEALQEALERGTGMGL